jgi:polysaccharide export outer membrane protein
VLKPIKTYLPQITLLLALLILASCSYKRKNILFKTPKKIKSKDAVATFNDKGEPIPENKEIYFHRIKTGDRLKVTFLNNYDIGQAAVQSATSTANSSTGGEGYLVNYDSTVTLPLIGRIKMVGLNRLEAAKKLESEYGKYIINPIIEVNILSLSVSMFGEINTPGKILIDKENTTLVDVIALAGGMKDPGKKNTIKIIRGKTVTLVNLRQIESLQYPAINIQDGDIIYVEPYGYKAQTEPLSSVQSSTFIILTISQLTLLTLQIVNFARNL